MKVTFFHDTVFVEDKGKYYTKDGLNQEVLDEYIQQFGDLTIVSRSELAGPNVLTILVFFMSKTSPLKNIKDDFYVALYKKLKTLIKPLFI